MWKKAKINFNVLQ